MSAKERTAIAGEEKVYQNALSLTRQMGLLFVGRTAGFVVTFAIPLVLARVFTLGEFGLYKQIFLIHGTLFTILSVGLPASLYYFLPRNVKERGAYISQTLLLLVGIGTIAFVGLIFFRGSISLLLNNPALSIYVPYLGLLTLLTLPSLILEVIMISTKQFKLASLTIVVSEFLKSLFTIGAAAITGSVSVLIGVAIMLYLFRIATLTVYLRKEGLFSFESIRTRSLYSQLVYAIPFGLAASLEILAISAPQFLVSYYYDPAAFAVYAVGCFTVPLVPLLFDSVSEVTLVEITGQVQAGALDHVTLVLSDSIRKLSLVCFPLFIFLLTVAREFILGLYTSKFEASIPIFMIFVFTILLTALSVDYVPRAFADVSFLVKMYALRMVTTIILVILLTKSFGLSGAALATVLALGVTRMYALIKVKQLARTTFKALVPWRILGTILAYSMIPAVIILVVKHYVNFPVLVSLFGSLIIFVVTYLALILNSEVVREEEKAALAHYTQRARAMAVGLLTQESRKVS